jgi:putative selenate reductase FAD-binding subunit
VWRVHGKNKGLKKGKLNLFGLKEYHFAHSLEQADKLLHSDKGNVILGGLLWMRMGRKNYNTGIDLANLGLNGITETEDGVEIGCMATLRQIETSKTLQDCFGKILTDSVSHIVGVQFRNSATIGGSVFSRFSFSDILTALLALEARVHLYRGGTLPLETFIDMPPKKDILVKLTLKKRPWKTSYQSHRMTATDFPVLAAAVGSCEGRWRIALGARPARAKLALKAAALLPEKPSDTQIKAACDQVVEELTFGSNQRGKREYRQILATILVKRGIETLCR